MDVENREFRDLFRPFSFRTCRVLLAGKLLFTGYLLDVSPSIAPDRRVVAVSAYSKATVWQDACLPPDVPHQFDGLKLLQLAAKLGEPFGLTPRLGPGASEGSKFPKVVIKADEKILGFLTDLAQQRGLVIGTDEFGEPVFRTSAPGNGIPVASLTEGISPVVSVVGTFTPQEFFSSVTCLGTTKHGRKGTKYTEPNPFLTSVVRPTCIELDDSDPGDIHLATKARLARMMGNVCSWEVELPTWFTPSGDLWQPDMRVLLEAPNAFIFRISEFVIQSVDLKKDSEGTTTCKLGLVLPGAFSSEMPKELPWTD